MVFLVYDKAVCTEFLYLSLVACTAYIFVTYDNTLPTVNSLTGYTPIILAAWNSFPQIVQTLLDYKADPDAVSIKTRKQKFE